MQGRAYIKKLRLQWISVYAIQGLTVCIGLTLLTVSIYRYFLEVDYLAFAIVFLASASIYLFVNKIWKIDETYVVRYLDTNFPDLEDSAALLLKPSNDLGLLESLQVSKISENLPHHQIKGWGKMIVIGLVILAIGLIAFFTIKNTAEVNDQNAGKSYGSQSTPVIKENVLPQVENYFVTITPPAYTKQKSRTQKQFYIKAETDAQIKWQLETNQKVTSFYITFNDTERVKLTPLKGDGTKWIFNRKAEKQGFYQLELDGVKSDLYQIDIIPDLPVSIKISKPKSQTTIDIGQPKVVDLKANLTDDYGITSAFISATMASGKGESVSFTEKKINFNSSISGQRNIQLNKQIDLKALGMKPGDELYFFISAKDSKGQESRSDVHFVSIVDTAELMSMAGMTSGVNLVPEYFRSERQIIIDTEKLLAEKETLKEADFKTRSNDLGIDQKLLRLRYGQFLGEENETQIGGDDEHYDGDGHNHSSKEEPAKFGDVQALMDKYAHKHDIAEDATFFEPEIKAQLKAVLNEMWKAELKLRTFKPQEALPFEYKALRLLKDLQQKSRAYVAKTTVKTASLKTEKRLTGELDKINQPRQQLNQEIKNSSKEELQLILALLDIKQNGSNFSANEKALMKSAEKQIITAAAKHPETYLGALQRIKKLNVQSRINKADITVIAKAIYQIMGLSDAKPNAMQNGLSKSLANSYFNNLKKY